MTLYRWLSVIFIWLICLVVLAVSTLSLMIYGDARTALAHAKVVKLALENSSQSAYAYGSAFVDPSQQGGVKANVYEKVLSLSKANGDFWLLQSGRNGYGVVRFEYYEGLFTVVYDADPASWVVKINFQLVYAELNDSGIASHNASELEN